MFKIYNFLLPLILFGLVGCATPQATHETNTTQETIQEEQAQISEDTNSSQPLAINFQEVHWQTIGINGKAIMISENKPYIKLKLDNNRLQGFGGCNLLFGSYSLGAEHSVEFPMVASTKRACPNLDLEDEFLKMLAEVKSYAVEEGVLLLYDKAHQPIATFESLD